MKRRSKEREKVNRWSLYDDLPGYGKANRAMESAFAKSVKAGLAMKKQGIKFERIFSDLWYGKEFFGAVHAEFDSFGTSDTAVREIAADRIQKALGIPDHEVWS